MFGECEEKESDNDYGGLVLALKEPESDCFEDSERNMCWAIKDQVSCTGLQLCFYWLWGG
jgi:hypothetical protein